MKIIDFGSTRVTGVVEASPPGGREDILGTFQYTALEYFLGENGSSRSDIFSLGVITYQMMTGRLPYGAKLARTRTKSQQRKLKYRSALDDTSEIPAWIDSVLKKAVHPDPWKRYEALSEFLHDLRTPNADFVNAATAPLIERNPLLFWKGLSALLVLMIVVLLAMLQGGR